MEKPAIPLAPKTYAKNAMTRNTIPNVSNVTIINTPMLSSVDLVMSIVVQDYFGFHYFFQKNLLEHHGAVRS